MSIAIKTIIQRKGKEVSFGTSFWDEIVAAAPLRNRVKVYSWVTRSLGKKYLTSGYLIITHIDAARSSIQQPPLSTSN
jgi:hypothetical protein